MSIGFIYQNTAMLEGQTPIIVSTARVYNTTPILQIPQHHRQRKKEARKEKRKSKKFTVVPVNASTDRPTAMKSSPLYGGKVIFLVDLGVEPRTPVHAQLA